MNTPHHEPNAIFDPESDTPFDRLAQAIRFTLHGRPCHIPNDHGDPIPTLDHTGLAWLSVDELKSLDGWALTIEASSGDPSSDDGYKARIRIAEHRYHVTIWEQHRPIAEFTRTM